MHKVNELYGKQVINQSTGERVAAVRDVVLDPDARRIVALVVSDGMWSKEERVIRWDTVTSIGDFVIAEGTQPFAVIDEDTEVADLRKQAHKITGTMILSSTGERMGTIGDMFYDESGAIAGYSIKQGIIGSSDEAPFLAAEQVQAVGKDAVIANVSDLAALRTTELLADVPQEPAEHVRDPATVELQERVVGEPPDLLEDTRYDPVDPPADAPAKPLPGKQRQLE